jgi:NAD+ synthase (glutamine-hydrolysing)
MAETRTLRIALAQLNPTVGDIAGNSRLIGEWIGRAQRAGAQVVLFPELALNGYPPEDLLLKRHFLDAGQRALEEIATEVGEIVALVGFAAPDAGASNALAVLHQGEVRGCYRKSLLPNYGVFDERRYFEPGSGPALIRVCGVRIGLTVCEDIWFPGPPASTEVIAGASLILNASSSPYHAGKGLERERMVAERAREVDAAFGLCNAVGGQDELVFDGHSVLVDAQGNTLARAIQFSEELLVCDLDLDARVDADGGAEAEALDVPPAAATAPVLLTAELGSPRGSATPPLATPLDPEAEVYRALTLGLGDYVRKNGFERVLIALSGGIDSALVALLACDALGPERVTCVVMPSPHTSAGTHRDAEAIAENLGTQLIEISITGAIDHYSELLAGPFAAAAGPQDQAAIAARAGTETAPGTAGAGVEWVSEPGVAEENIQARIRGNLVMALSNKFGWLVLTTGNKSELSVGYATLYGDMAGGFAVIKDVPKTLVYRLVRHRNSLADAELVPISVLERPPSAELRPDQRDEDSLPPYETLDRILEAYVEQDRGRDEIVSCGLEAALVDEVIEMVDRAEYKRRQAPPGVKISPKAFGRDRRLPITNRFGG